MTQHRQAADKTVQAISLIEEACLAVLIDHLARTGDEDGLSTQEIAERISLVSWLGPDISEAVVGKVLFTLMMSHRTAPIAETLVAARWKITEIEASIRPMPVIGPPGLPDADTQPNRATEPAQ